MTDFDTKIFPALSLRNQQAFHTSVERLRNLFSSNAFNLNQVTEKAQEYKKAFDALDPLIQYHTSRVCPYCGMVCCANKHGFPAFEDLVGILAMGLDLPEYRFDVNENDMCQFMGPEGCLLPRHQRPYRCTWYFCDPLLIQLEIGPPDHYHRFVRDTERLSAARIQMIKAFHPIWMEFACQGGHIST